MLRTGLFISTLAFAALWGGSTGEASGMHEDLSAQSIAPVVDAYEQVRVHLVSDRFGAALSASSRLAKAAAKLAQAQGGEVKRRAASLATAAKKLGAAKANDPAGVRSGFGQVSQALIALVTAHPEARKGLHIFECPMAKGFKKWVQRDGKLANPYMGTAMPKCGGPSRWG